MRYNFLLCSERSGSNLITKMLDGHPSICGPTPTHLFRLFTPLVYQYGNLSNDINWRNLVEDIIAYLNFQLGEWRVRFTTDILLNEIGQERSLSTIFKYIYTKEAKSQNANQVFIKENKTYDFLAYSILYFNNPKFIYLVRDPRDTILSFKKSINHPNGIISSTKIWKNDQTEFLKSLSFLIEGGYVFFLRYEDLIEETEKYLRKVCKFLELQYSDEMLSFYKNDLTQKNSEKWADWKNLSKPVINNNKRKYLSELSELEIKYIELECNELMQIFNYKVENESPISLSTNELNFLINQDELTIKTKQQKGKEADKQNIRKNRIKTINKILHREKLYLHELYKEF